MQSTEYTLTFLGTGTSIGIPVPGCGCKICRSRDKRNRRMRSSVLIEAAGRRLLIDTAPEFRLQALEAGIDRLDAVFWTHGHADHLHGLDDLRALTWRRPVEGYAGETTAKEIQTRFDYLWKTTQKGGGKAKVNLHEVAPDEFIRIPVGDPLADVPAGDAGGGGEEEPTSGHRVLNSDIVRAPTDSREFLEVIPLPVNHGRLPIFGWRCGPIAYITDASEIPETTYPLLENVEILVLGALHFKPHPTHFNVQRALEEIKKIRPGRAYLTHISHEASHRAIRRAAPGNVQPARDGLRLRAKG